MSPTPASSAMKTSSTQAQTPNTASTSDNRCHKPAWAPPLFAKRAKTGTENVWITASAKRTVASTSIKLGMLEPDVAKIERYECERVNMLLTRADYYRNGRSKRSKRQVFMHWTRQNG